MIAGNLLVDARFCLFDALFISLHVALTILCHQLECDTTFSPTEKNRMILSHAKRYDIFECKYTIFLHVKILVQRSNEKPHRIFY